MRTTTHSQECDLSVTLVTSNVECERQNHRAAASDLVKCKQRTTAAPVHFIVMPLLFFLYALWWWAATGIA